MSITATRFDVSQIVADAMNYCVMPLAHMAEVRRDGPIVYVRGEGIVLTDVNGNKYLDFM